MSKSKSTPHGEPVSAKRAPWQRVVFASDCYDPDGEDGDREILFCPICKEDYAECPCPGPSQEEEFEYEERDGVLYARRLPEEDDDE